MTKAPTHFIEYLENSGLKKKKRRGLSSFLRFQRILFRMATWTGASVGALVAARNYNDIAGATDALMYHLKDFAEVFILLLYIILVIFIMIVFLLASYYNTNESISK